MTGREETSMQYENRVRKRLENAPKVMRDYITSLSTFTSSTRIAYVGYMMSFFKFLNERFGYSGESYDDFKNIRKIDIDSYMEYIRYNPKTGGEYGISIRNTKLAAVNSFFEFLIDNNIILSNPCAKVKKVQGNIDHEVTYLTVDEVDSVIANILSSGRSINVENKWMYRDYAMFLMFCTTGMRKSALREINLCDLDLDNRKVQIYEKRNCRKIMYLSTQVCDALQKWCDIRKDIVDNHSEALFISNRKERMGIKTIDYAIEKYTKILGKHITPHKLRSTCAMNLYEKTGDIYLVAQQLGHKNIRNTQIYAKATEAKMKDTAELMDKIYGGK